MGRRKEPTAEDQAEQEAAGSLAKLGKQLIGSQKPSKDVLLKHLKAASRLLEDAPQSSERIIVATGDLCKAISKNEFLKHRDKEVRLYTAACVIQILRLHAPDTPFTDAQLETIFSLFMSVFKELADPGAAHFQVCLGLLDTAAVIKCCLLMLDLDHANSLVSDLFSTLFDVVNAENKDAVEGPALQVLTVMLEESDDIPQPLLDGILGHLLPSARQESPVAHHMAQLLLRRAQPTLQPYVQKFLTRLLEGGRTDSELAGSCSDLILQVYQAAPQIMLPVIPHLQPGLQVESEERRLDSVDLICKLLTQPGGHSLVTDYPQLTDAVLSRLGDRSADVRMRVLSHARSLADCAADEEHRVKVADAVVLRLQDPEEKLRSAAAVELCGIAADHPHIMHTQQYQPLIQRLRDKRLPVRKEVAAQIVKLVKAWCMKLEDDSSTRGIRKEFVVNLVLGICGLTVTKDVELGAYILDDLFRAGIFPARLPAVSAARWWELVWQAGGKGGQSVLLKIIKGKCDVQRKVQEVLSLRERAKGEKGGAAKLNFGGEQEARGAEEPPAAQEGESAAEQMEGLLNNLASLLPSISKAEEGLQKLFAMKDNHIFRALGTLARFGTPYADAAQAAKDLQGRVGSRGPVADVVHSLSSRMMPNVIFPETLAALMDSMGESENAYNMVTEVAKHAPQVFAQSLPAIVQCFESDDSMAAEAAAQVLAVAGSFIFHAASDGSAEPVTVPDSIINQIKDIALSGTPKGAKAAVKALALALGPEGSTALLRQVCTKLHASLSKDNAGRPHTRILAELKAMSMALRMNPTLLVEFADGLHQCVMQHLLNTDLSGGKPLGFASAGDDASAGLTWGKPSPDVAIKAAAIKTLAQALVSEDASASPQEDVAGVASSFAVELGELCELDPTTPAFQGFRWRLLQVKWLGQERANSAASSGGSSGSGRKRKASEYDADDPEVVDPNDFTEEEREALVRDTQEASPDAGWVRLAAASALFRLFRGYNKTLTGNEYVVMGLSCQDKLVEVRRALIDKITAGVAHFLTVQGKPQRAAKLAALYALYAADPDEHNVQLAYARLREYAVSRRAEVDRKAMALASEEQEVILFNSMPDLILPSLVFFAAHHPDYDNQAVFQDDTAFLDLFQRCFQMALEVLMLPDAAVAGSSEAMVEVSRRVGAVQKLLRRLKYCKVLSIDVSEEDDPVATTSAHQLCDIALLLVKQLIQWAAAGQTLPLQKFGGKVVLPKGCFKGETGLEREDKRTDGCGLPPSYHPVLEEPLFSAAYGIASPAMKPRPKGRSKPREQVVEQNQQAGGDLAPGTVAKKAAAPKRRPAGAAAKEKAQPKRRPKLIKAVASPVRHQPRRGAKDVAEDKLRDMELDGDEGSTLSTDAEANESESDQPAVRGALLKVAGTVPDLRATSSGEEGSSEEDAGFIDSPGQENGNRLNTKAAGLGAKAVKPAAAAAKPRAKRAKA